jgi:hypothetical protein
MKPTKESIPVNAPAKGINPTNINIEPTPPKVLLDSRFIIFPPFL